MTACIQPTDQDRGHHCCYATRTVTMMAPLTRGGVAARRQRGVLSAAAPTSSTATASTALTALARVVAAAAVLPTAVWAEGDQQQTGNDDLFAEGSGNMIIGVLVVIGLLMCGAGAYMWWYRYRGPNSDHAQAKAMAAYSFNPNAPGAKDGAAMYAGYPQQYYVPGPGNATPTPLDGVTVDGAGAGSGAGAGAGAGPGMMPPPGYQFVMGPNGPMLAPMAMGMGMPMPMPMVMPNVHAATPGAAGTTPQQAVAGGATPATGGAAATPAGNDVRPLSPGDETDDEDFAAELRAINDADDVEDIMTASRRLQLNKSQRQANSSTRGGTSASQEAASNGSSGVAKAQPVTSTHVSSTSMAPSTASGSSRMGSPSGVAPTSNATPAAGSEESVPGDGVPAAAAAASASSRRQSHLSLSSITSDVDGGAVDGGDSTPGPAAAAAAAAAGSSAPPPRPSVASSTRTVDKIRSASDVNVSRASIISNTQAAIQRAMDGDGEFDDESLGSIDNDFSLLGDDMLELDEP